MSNSLQGLVLTSEAVLHSPSSLFRPRFHVQQPHTPRVSLDWELVFRDMKMVKTDWLPTAVPAKSTTAVPLRGIFVRDWFSFAGS